MSLWRALTTGAKPSSGTKIRADDWLAAFPQLKDLEEPARIRLADAARVKTLPSGFAAFGRGSPCESYLFIVSGTVRVQMISESGREIVLYRVGGGETCILTTACLLSQDDYPADARTETDVEVAMVPASAFRDLVAASAVFRDFVFRSYGRRIADLMLLLEEVAFRRVDVRLAKHLIARSAADELTITHQELAVDLGSAREVISRQLKEFERRGWVVLRRGRIEIANAAALRDLADQSGT